jgi:hypothetical protein
MPYFHPSYTYRNAGLSVLRNTCPLSSAKPAFRLTLLVALACPVPERVDVGHLRSFSRLGQILDSRWREGTLAAEPNALFTWLRV